MNLIIKLNFKLFSESQGKKYLSPPLIFAGIFLNFSEARIERSGPPASRGWLVIIVFGKRNHCNGLASRQLGGEGWELGGNSGAGLANSKGEESVETNPLFKEFMSK